VRLGSILIQNGQNSKGLERYKHVLEIPNDGKKFTKTIVKLAEKYLRTGGEFAIFDILYQTNQIDKLYSSNAKEKKIELSNLIDKIAKKNWM